MEDDKQWVVDRRVACNKESDIGKIPADSMQCEFTLQMPDGSTYPLVRDCYDRSLREVNWYRDLQEDI
jgi:hypothetical protein